MKEKTINDKYLNHFISEITKGDIRDYIGSSELPSKPNKIYTAAVYQGYLDMCRTLRFSSKHNKETINEALNNLSQKIGDYFKNESPKNAESYDESFNEFMGSLDDSSKLTIGQKQKIINMAFKYLFCCKCFRTMYSSYFDYCHMPLDKYTLSWYKRVCQKRSDKEKIGDTTWSSINEIELYRFIVEKIRNKLDNRLVLICEFEIWEKEKQLENLKTLQSFIKANKSSPSPALSNCFINSLPSKENCEKMIKKITNELKYE